MKRLSSSVSAFLIVALFLSGCAQRSSQIDAVYVSPIKYEKYSCRQLNEELQRINARVAEISKEQDGTAAKDVIVGTVGVVAFLPALFLLALGDDHKDEIARLKGEYEAIRSTALRKKCKWATKLPKTK